ncbi:beta-fructosidase [candidate division KSB1 bacterium]|nr:beta-fructosidase [candidate division KSB1 bacterium]
MKMISANKHPTKFTWDYWYYFDHDEKLFHIFNLNAKKSLAKKQQHHFSSQVGYATTRDFVTINWIKDDVLVANPSGWDNSSIWTGDIVKSNNGFVMFYTSRDKHDDDGMTQNIGCAFSNDFLKWERIPNVRIQPEPAHYLTQTSENDGTIHAWRDPFLFREGDYAYMLVSAKANDLPAGRNACVALLRSEPHDLLHWNVLPPICKPGWYGEMEVPQLYLDKDGRHQLIFSVGEKWDYADDTQQQGGLQSIDVTQGRKVEFPIVRLPQSAGIYACRVIPEMGGAIIGFDIKVGGFVKCDGLPDFKYMNRDFTDFKQHWIS